MLTELLSSVGNRIVVRRVQNRILPYRFHLATVGNGTVS